MIDAAPESEPAVVECCILSPALRCDLLVERPGERPVLYVAAALHGAGGIIAGRGCSSSSVLRVMAEIATRAMGGKDVRIYVSSTPGRDVTVEVPAHQVRVLRAWSKGV